MIWSQVSGLSIMPAASASGLGMAMTVGVRARLGCRSGIIRSAVRLADASFTQAVESGTQTSGCVPSVGSQSVVSAVAITEDSRATIVTDPQAPLTDGDVFAQSVARLCMIGAIRG